ncbi:MAG: exosortase/archaeosortase family protein [Candidatus Diapherotrites archaeon]
MKEKTKEKIPAKKQRNLSLKKEEKFSVKKEIKKLFSDAGKKTEQLKGLKFTALVLVWFIGLNGILFLIPLTGLIQLFYAHAGLFALNFFGFQGKVILEEVPVIVFSNFDYNASITYLCSGVLETIVLISCIMASIGISWKKRIIGSLIGIILLGIGNIKRIVLSVLILKFFGNFWGNLFHEILFKIFLFIGIAGIYFIWFLWATENKKFKELIGKVKKKIKA